MENLSKDPVVNRNIEIENNFNNQVKYFSLTQEDLQKTILDVGVAKGDFINYLRNVLGNKNAYGVEKEEDPNGQNIDGIFVADGLNLPFDKGTFEIVTAKHYLPTFLKLSIEDNKKALDELIRVLKPGGVLLCDIFTLEEMEKFRLPSKDVYSADGLEDGQDWYSIRIDKYRFQMNHLDELKKVGYEVSFSVNERGDTILRVVNNNR